MSHRIRNLRRQLRRQRERLPPPRVEKQIADGEDERELDPVAAGGGDGATRES